MFISKVHTRTSNSGVIYYSYKLLSCHVVGGMTKQTTIHNLGSRFSFPPELWKELTVRIEELLSGCPSLFPARPEVEVEARRIFEEIVRKRAVNPEDRGKTPLNGYYAEDVELKDVRTVGVERVGLYAIESLHIPQIFSSLGFDKGTIDLLIALIIGRMAHPGSEASTFNWLQRTSGLGDLLDVDFGSKSVMALHRAADALNSKKDEIEDLIYQNLSTTINDDSTIALYDLTNTYFEGNPNDEDAKRGFSKEKRSDCPLVSLGIMMDWSGFIRKSKIFPGNVSEPKTLEVMINALNPPRNTMVIMDRGIATAENVAWLIEKGFRYLVVNRERTRVFDDKKGEPLKVASGEEILVYSQVSDDGAEQRLYCRSPKRALKERAMLDTRMKKYESALRNLNEKLSKPRTKKDIASVNRALGRLAEGYSGVSHYYAVSVHDNSLFNEPNRPIEVLKIEFNRKEISGGKLSLPGVYCLKTNDLSLPPEQIWRTYIRLTKLESVFRSLKSELGLRPVFHKIKDRIDSHLFISILAYQCIHIIRHILAGKYINDSWKTIVNNLQTHIRITSIY
jgi:transposase